MSNDKHTDNKEVTKHTVLSWAGLEVKVEGNKLNNEEVVE